jgi:adenylyltransferase/sulfurtransferase
LDNDRYIRHFSVPGFSKEVQEKLGKTTVAVIGAGGLGCPVLMQLVGAGVGHIILVENDTIQLSNLPRQSLYITDDVGKLKTETAIERLTAINPEVSFAARNTRLDSENALSLLAPADLVIDCSDNFSTRYLVNDACVILNKPWVFGAIESWKGQYAAFNYPVGAGPTYRCIFPEPPTDAADCNVAGVLPPLPALVGSYMANAALQILAEIPNNLSAKLININLLENSFHSLTFSRDEMAVKGMTGLNGKEYNKVSCEREEIELTVEAYRSNPSAYTLIDIRDEFDFESNPSPGNNIPYYILLSNPEMLERSGKTVLLLCDTGKRSLMLARKITEAGINVQAKSLVGGMSLLFSR